jgi:hypothetical protein
MQTSSATEVQASNYQVKNVQPVMIDTDMQARLFTLAPAVPWHSRREAADHYFVLDGELTVSTRARRDQYAATFVHVSRRSLSPRHSKSAIT